MHLHVAGRFVAESGTLAEFSETEFSEVEAKLKADIAKHKA